MGMLSGLLPSNSSDNNTGKPNPSTTCENQTPLSPEFSSSLKLMLLTVLHPLTVPFAQAWLVHEYKKCLSTSSALIYLSLSPSVSPRESSYAFTTLVCDMIYKKKKLQIMYIDIDRYIYIFIFINIKLHTYLHFSISFKTCSFHTPKKCAFFQGNLANQSNSSPAIFMTFGDVFPGFPARKCLNSALRKWRALGEGGIWCLEKGMIKRYGTLPEIDIIWHSCIAGLTHSWGSLFYNHFPLIGKGEIPNL